MANSMLSLVAVAALAAHIAEAKFPISQIGCAAGTTLWPTCSSIGVDQILCPAGAAARSQALPACAQLNQQNTMSMANLLCPTNGGTDTLPSCVKVPDSTIPTGSVNPAQVTSGTIPSSTKVLNQNIPVGALGPARITGPLSATVSVSNANINGNVPYSKFAGGTLPSGVTVNSNNFPPNSINTNQLAGGNLPSGIKVGDSNFAAGSIDPSKLSAGLLPSGIKVNSDNIAYESFPAGNMTCTDSQLTNLSCVAINAENLGCSGVTADLPACASLAGESITGTVAAAQIVGDLTHATVEPAQIQCTGTDLDVPLPSCMRINASSSDQLTCGAAATASVELPCLALNASNVGGMLGENAIVDVSLLVGNITDDSVSVDGTKVLNQTILADQLPLFESTDLFSPSQMVKVPTAWQGTGDPSLPVYIDVEVCCPSGIVTACVNPFMNWQAVTGLLYVSFDVDGGPPVSISINATTGLQCCNWHRVTTDAPLGLNDGGGSYDYVPATFTALCMPDPEI